MKTLDVISSYDSISEASNKNNIGISSISQVCRGIGISNKGYYWCFKNDFEKFKPKRLKTKTK